MRILVTGGRHYQHANAAYVVLDAIAARRGIDLIIHGGASGADQLAANWAVSRRVALIACPADWKLHGKAAGPIRNAAMLRDHAPDLILAFPGGRGTADMIHRAELANVPVVFAVDVGEWLGLDKWAKDHLPGLVLTGQGWG